jgi:hypothetical protein
MSKKEDSGNSKSLNNRGKNLATGETVDYSTLDIPSTTRRGTLFIAGDQAGDYTGNVVPIQKPESRRKQAKQVLNSAFVESKEEESDVAENETSGEEPAEEVTVVENTANLNRQQQPPINPTPEQPTDPENQPAPQTPLQSNATNPQAVISEPTLETRMTVREREVEAISTLIKNINDDNNTNNGYNDIQAILLKNNIETIQEVLAKTRELYETAITAETNLTGKQAIKRKQDGLCEAICIIWEWYNSGTSRR